MGRRIRPLLVALAALLALSSIAHGADRRDRSGGGDRLLDVREGARAPVSGAARAAQRRLGRRLGRGGVLRVEPSTGTPRFVTDLNGSLTRRSSQRPAVLARRFLRDQRRAYGLDAREAASLEAEHEYRSREGVSYVRLRQTYRGVPAFDGSLTAAVRDGRLLSVAGAPQPDLSVPSVTPRLSAARARGIAQRDAGVRARRPRREARPLRRAGGHPPGLVAGRLRRPRAGTEHGGRRDLGPDPAPGEPGPPRRHRPGARPPPGGCVGLGLPGQELQLLHRQHGAESNTRLRGNFAWTYEDETATDDGLDSPNPGAGIQIPPSSGSGTTGADWTYTPVAEPSVRGRTHLSLERLHLERAAELLRVGLHHRSTTGITTATRSPPRRTTSSAASTTTC